MSWSHCMCRAWILAAGIPDSRMLCTADKHCSQLCMAMLQMLLLWPVSMLHFMCSACWAVLVTLHVLCLHPCSRHTRQQSALHSRQALLSAVHGNAADAAAVACVYAAFHVLCMLGCLGQTACAVPASLQQAYQTAECFAQQTSIALSCAWQCCRCCCCGLCLCCSSRALHAGLSWSHCVCCACILAAGIPDSRVLCTADKHCSQLCMAMLQMLLLWPVSMLHFTCSACWAVLVKLHVPCLHPCSRHTRQQSALHSRQALLSAVHGNAADAAAVACVYAAVHVLCMLGCLGHTACAVPASLQQAYQTAECFAQQTSIALSCAWQCCRCCCCGLCLCCISRALHAGLSWSNCMCRACILAAGIPDSKVLCTADKHCSQLCMAMLQMLLLWPVSYKRVNSMLA